MSADFSLENFLSEWNGFCDEEFFFFDEIDSTNSELLRRGKILLPLLDDDGNLSASGKKFNFCVAASASQTSGRGRVGRKFLSPEKTGVYFSFAFVKKNGIQNPASVTVSCAVGICRALEKIFPVECKIKWVNDVYCNGKKIAGVLTEGIANPQSGKVECAVAGIGINIFTGENFSDELKKKAGGVADNLGCVNFSRTKIIAQCLKEIFSVLQRGENVSEEYRRRSFVLGRTLEVFSVADGGEKFSATATGITDNFELEVLLPDGTKRVLNSGEVTLHAGE